MKTFDELGLDPALIQALAAEGLETATPLQEDALPVLRRGNNLVLAAGPGAGTLVTWGAALLDRLDAEATETRALILTPTAPIAGAMAESLARLAGATGHTVAALGSPWALPERAHVLFASVEDARAAAESGELSLGEVEALVVDQADKLETLGLAGDLEAVLDFLPKDSQRIVTALPLTDAVQDLVARHVRRAAVLPPRPADGSRPEKAPHRGDLRFRVVPESREDGLLATVAELLGDEGARHVLVFTRSDDRAADVGDFLTLHGYVAGAPGDPDVPVWLGVDALEAREAMGDELEGVRVVSCDAPVGPDELDRRHGVAEGGVVVLLPREIAHLRDVARRTGYDLTPMPLTSSSSSGELDAFRDRLAKAVEEEDVEAYQLVLQPLFERYDPAQVAAAAAALLRSEMEAAPAPAPAAGRKDEPPAWVRVFLSVGDRDGLTPGDLLGAITGESGVPGDAVGKIDIQQSHSLVDIKDEVARKVIRALNGTTIRGRAVRADADRGPGGRSGGGRRSGGRRG